MSKTKWIVMWGVLALISLLTLLSLYGAFIGADRAKAFFNTLPLSVFWIAFILLLGAGIIIFKSLLRSPGQLLSHLGGIAIILGAMWGSQGGHEFQKNLLGKEMVQNGTLLLYEGQSDNRVPMKNANLNIGARNGRATFFEGEGSTSRMVSDHDERVFTLPFEIRLTDFHMEYYSTAQLLVKDQNGKEFLLESLKVGTRYKVANDAEFTIKALFNNAKMRQVEGKYDLQESPASGSNPAIKVLIQYEDGSEEEQIAFANYPSGMGQQKRFSLQYRTGGGMVKDYFSDLQVIENGKVVKEKTIEVNDPLYYGGYHFYQSSYDSRAGQYTVLSVSSDSGLYLVYAGYWMLCVGIIWQMWFLPIYNERKRLKLKEGGTNGN